MSTIVQTNINPLGNLNYLNTSTIQYSQPINSIKDNRYINSSTIHNNKDKSQVVPSLRESLQPSINKYFPMNAKTDRNNSLYLPSVMNSQTVQKINGSSGPQMIPSLKFKKNNTQDSITDGTDIALESNQSSANPSSRKYKYYIKKFSDKYQKPLGGLGPNYDQNWE